LVLIETNSTHSWLNHGNSMTEQTGHLDGVFEVDADLRSRRNGHANGVELSDAERAELERRTYHAPAPTPGKWSANVSAERTLAERAYAAIYGAIIDGTFAPGDRLRIEDLSESLSISPTPIREALNRLEAAGLAEHVPHRGSRVTMVSASEFRDLYELRFILEPLAAAKAAESFTKEDEQVARGHLDRLSEALQAKEIPDAWDAHTAFHFTLYRAAKSRWLERLIAPLWDSCRRYRLQQSNLLANPVQNRAEHDKILSACVQHDSASASLELYNHTARNANVIAKANYGESFFQLKE
jgi:DNA-binding GntR family transcriptional regulator